MKKHRCCTDAADVGNTSHSGEARRNEMAPMATLSLMPLGTVTCRTKRHKLPCNCCYYFRKDEKYNMYCGSITSTGTWEGLSQGKSGQLIY